MLLIHRFSLRPSLVVTSFALLIVPIAIGGYSAAQDRDARPVDLPPTLSRVNAGVDGCFATSPTCARCRSAASPASAMKDASGRNVAPYDLWHSSMMANAARDPLWRGVDTDPDFRGGSDAIVYSVPTGTARGPFTVEVERLIVQSPH